MQRTCQYQHVKRKKIEPLEAWMCSISQFYHKKCSYPCGLWSLRDTYVHIRGVFHIHMLSHIFEKTRLNLRQANVGVLLVQV